MRTQFTQAELLALQAAFSGIEQVLPERLPEIRAIFSGAHDDAVKQLVGAKIKFVSKLAANECIRRGVAP